jgi:hypothetical protein
MAVLRLNYKIYVKSVYKNIIDIKEVKTSQPTLIQFPAERVSQGFPY